MKITTKLIITESNNNDYSKLKECADIVIMDGVEVKFPALTTSGNIYLSENAKAEFPALTTSGNIYLRTNAKLIHPKTNQLNYKSVDNTMFVIESQKTSKGIIIQSGYVVKGFKNKSIIKEPCFVAEKDNFFAHGETVKKAIGDLQFKIVAEKLKNGPITKDTEFTVMYYRTLTGACDLGCRSFMESNKIPFDVLNKGKITEETILVDKDKKPTVMKAKDLLPILEKTRPYGYEKFKQLVTF